MALAIERIKNISINLHPIRLRSNLKSREGK